MLKVIELDGQGKDADGFVFTLSIGDARYGVTDQEVAEFIRNKYANGKAGSKKAAPRKTQMTESAHADNLPAMSSPDGDLRPSADGVEPSH